MFEGQELVALKGTSHSIPSNLSKTLLSGMVEAVNSIITQVESGGSGAGLGMGQGG